MVRMKLVGANPKAKVSGLDELPGKSNYFVGNDPKKWRTNVANYAKVKYANVYPGVDLVYYGNQRQLEYDFVVQPGADPRQIALDVGAGLVLPERAPQAAPLRVDSYRLEDENHIRFEVSPYDHSRPLVIDPTLVYSTYLGGAS